MSRPSKLNGSARRKLTSWIEAFIRYSDNLEAPLIFRKWAAITAIAAALEQKVWLTTSAPLYPNLYTILVGHPGVGKTRTIMAARAFLADLPDFHIAPTSVLMASLVDCLVEAKRTVINLPHPPLEFNSMTLMVDEFGAFMHKYDDELIGGLTTFYDVAVPYSQHRRGKEIRIKIESPQLNILAGSTPSNLIKFMPEIAWDQGFTSRIIMVYSNERELADNIFANPFRTLPRDMLHDVRCINALVGEFMADQDYQDAIGGWRKGGQKPVPNHPKLLHYNTRRLAHLLKLSMVSSIDRGDTLKLTHADYDRALGWLLEAELAMPAIFQEGASVADTKVMDEIQNFVASKGQVGETKLVDFARRYVPANYVMNLIKVMEVSGMIKMSSLDPKTSMRIFTSLGNSESPKSSATQNRLPEGPQTKSRRL